MARNNRCNGKSVLDCRYRGIDYGLGIEIHWWIEVIVSSGLLKCEDTETCETWEVSTDGFYKAYDDFVQLPNPLLCSGIAGTALPKKTPWFVCPGAQALDVYTRWSGFKEAALEAANQYIRNLTPEVRKMLCEYGRH